MQNIADILSQGVLHQQKGRYKEALQAYNVILARDPEHPDALNLSGIIASRTGEHDKAVRLIKKALIHSPRNSGYLNSLGNALLAGDDLQAALEAYLEGLALDPGDLDLLYNTGRVYKLMGAIDKAAIYYHKVLDINPDDAWTLNGLGNLQKELGKLEEATMCFRRAIALNPQFGKAYNNLANTCREQGRYDDALEYYRTALEIEPADPTIYANLGVARLDVGRASEAIASFQTALKLDPGHAGACRNLGNAYLAQGRVKAALNCYRDVLNRAPADADTHSNLLCGLNNAPGYSQSRLAESARDWWRRHGIGVKVNDRFNNPADPERRLKVGYVSPDFRQHSVSHFFKPMLTAHNRESVEVFCYANVVQPDRVTLDLQEWSDHWRDIAGWSDQSVFEQVVNDEIDILVDLAGHTSGNRLTVFARQPAPVQVTWLGYPNTTGVPAMHYRITDAVADPQGDADRYHTEALVRLPHGFLCYQPPEKCPDVAPTPALTSGQVTFGSFNNIAKINPDVIRVWAGVLRSVPGSKLLLKNKQLADESVRSRYRELFIRQGVSPDQLEMLPYVLSSSGHMAVYNQVDVALDTFPYNGTTTTCEALWMGVPVVTLCGERHAARVGASLLTYGGYPELIAESEDAYLEKAVGLVLDLKALDTLRQDMRPRLETSHLCNADGFASELEQIYRGFWLKWCRRTPEKVQLPEQKLVVGTKGVPPEDARQVYLQGVALLAVGDLRKAEKVFERVVGLEPGHAEAHYNIGVLRQREGRLAEAVTAYSTAIKLDPGNPEAYYNLGNCCQALQQPDCAVDNYRRAIGLDPGFAPAHNNMGLVLKNTDRLDEAVDSLKSAIDLNPDAAVYHQNLGLVFQKQGRHLQAIACFQTALKREPDSPVTRYNLAAAFEGAGNYEQASRQLAGAVELDPDFGEAYHNYGDVLGKMGRYESAADQYRQAIRVKPDRPESWNGLGNALSNIGRTCEATDCYKRAIGLHPEYAGAYTNLGTACYEDRQLSLAEKYHRQALELDPGLVEAEFNLGLVYLLRGDLEKGWPGYEKRFGKSDWAANYPYRLDRPKWDGRPFKGQRLLVHDEQGLGDTLQFVRYLERVKPLGGQVLLETRKPFLELLKDLRCVDQLVERSEDGRPAVDFDLYCPLLSLPGIFSTALDAIPGRAPYIRADPEKTVCWAGRVAARTFKIGLVWSGNPTHYRGLNRSASLVDFEGLLRTPGVRFYGFQKGPAARDAARFTDTGLLENLGEDFTDFSDTAAAMANMDLVISIDTSVAHLAGAMGKPVWVLLTHAADWRWLMGRDDSPWYPTMRLFRQKQKNDWAGVMDEVQKALNAMLA